MCPLRPTTAFPHPRTTAEVHAVFLPALRPQDGEGTGVEHPEDHEAADALRKQARTPGSFSRGRLPRPLRASLTRRPRSVRARVRRKAQPRKAQSAKRNHRCGSSQPRSFSCSCCMCSCPPLPFAPLRPQDGGRTGDELAPEHDAAVPREEQACFSTPDCCCCFNI